jgi:capsular polysaccharide biosynthesis protein
VLDCHECASQRSPTQYVTDNLIFRNLKKWISAIYWGWQSFRNRVNLVSELRYLYRSKLKRFYIFRVLKSSVFSGFGNVRDVYRRMLRPLRRKKYMMVPMREYRDNRRCKHQIYSQEESITVPGPKFVGEVPDELVYENEVSVQSPRLEIVHICNPTVIGGTSFIISGTELIYPDLFDPRRDVPPVESFGLATIRPDQNDIILEVPRGTKRLYGAISLLGQCTGNYAHWLTETLPKLVILDDLPGYEDAPILIDGWIHPVFKESIELLSMYQREIVQLERWERMSLNCMVDISPPAYVPPEYRSFILSGELPVTGYDVFPFSRLALDMLRDRATAVVQDAAINSDKGKGRRLYLQRKKDSCGNARNIVNMSNVEKIIQQYDFEVVDPATLSLPEQIEIFSEAGFIISPVGAALANAIFARPGCNIIALSPYYRNANYYYFSNLMGVLGHELHYVIGPQVGKGGHPLHRNYRIDENALREAMELFCK